MQNIVVFTCIYHDEEKNRAVTNVGFIIRLFQQMNILYSLKFRFRHANIDFQPAHKPQHQRLLGPPNLSRGGNPDNGDNGGWFLLRKISLSAFSRPCPNIQMQTYALNSTIKYQLQALKEKTKQTNKKAVLVYPK